MSLSNISGIEIELGGALDGSHLKHRSIWPGQRLYPFA
jgi:hypothetical protein